MDDDKDKSIIHKVVDSVKNAVETAKEALTPSDDPKDPETKAARTKKQVYTGHDPTAGTAPTVTGRITPSYDDVLGPDAIAGMAPMPKKRKVSKIEPPSKRTANKATAKKSPKRSKKKSAASARKTVKKKVKKTARKISKKPRR